VAIWFHSEDHPFQLKQKEKHRKWIREIALSYKKRIASLNFVFISDSRILQINRDYLNHNYLTDVISFDYSEGDSISGDIFIGIDQVRYNAELYGDEPENEIRRVMAHGVLHLIGLDDQSEADRKIMVEKENKALTLWI
jgi:rRNA maturation RNase YbeY